MQLPTKVAAQGFGFATMNSITTAAPVFNTETGIISYLWDDLVQEKPVCPHCGKIMYYWYSRSRGVIISDTKYVFMAPRFKCDCGRTLTMHPYFIAPRKQYSIFSIQEILNSDVSSDRTIAISCGSLEVSCLRKWAVALVRDLVIHLQRASIQDERAFIKELRNCYGSCWLSSILQRRIGCASFFIPLQPDG